MRLRTLLIIMIGCLILGSGCSSGSERSVSRYMGEIVESFRKREKLEGLSVAVVAGGETVMVLGEGWADKASGRPLTAETPMPVGSISKLFTTLAILQLAGENHISLDSPVSVYLPKLKMSDGGEERIRVRDLLTHHGGLPGDRWGGWIPETSGLEELRSLPAELSDTTLISSPGTHFSYSNLGFDLLGLIIEQVSGMNYDAYIEENIFAAAGMSDAQVFPDKDDDRLPLGYGKGDPAPPACIRDIPAGAFLLSAEDGAAFIKALYPENGVGLISETAMAEMLTRQNRDAAADGRFEIGLGFWLIDPFGIDTPLASHGGELPPFNSILITIPEHRAGIMVSSNDFGKDGSGAVSLGVELAEVLIDFLGESIPGVPLPPEREWKAGEPEEWAGLYPSAAGPIVIESRGDDMFIRMSGKTMHAVPREENALSLELRILGIPLPIKALESIRLDLYKADGETWLGLWMGGLFGGSVRRIPLPVYDDEFSQYAGTYTLSHKSAPGPVDKLAIIEKKGIFFMEFKFLGMDMIFPLRSEGKNHAVTAGQGRGLGEHLHFRETARGLSLEWSGLDFERVK